MRQEKFTPGPYQVLPSEEGVPYIRVRGTKLGRKYKIAYCPFLIMLDGEVDKDEAIANAHLAAAGPEMYEALYGAINDMEEVLCHLCDACLTEDVTEQRAKIAKAKAALAKARGEQS